MLPVFAEVAASLADDLRAGSGGPACNNDRASVIWLSFEAIKLADLVASTEFKTDITVAQEVTVVCWVANEVDTLVMVVGAPVCEVIDVGAVTALDTSRVVITDGSDEGLALTPVWLKDVDRVSTVDAKGDGRLVAAVLTEKEELLVREEGEELERLLTDDAAEGRSDEDAWLVE